MWHHNFLLVWWENRLLRPIQHKCYCYCSFSRCCHYCCCWQWMQDTDRSEGEVVSHQPGSLEIRVWPDQVSIQDGVIGATQKAGLGWFHTQEEREIFDPNPAIAEPARKSAIGRNGELISFLRVKRLSTSDKLSPNTTISTAVVLVTLTAIARTARRTFGAK